MNGWLVALTGVAALVVSGAGGWLLTAGVLRLAARSSDAGRVHGDRADEPLDGEPATPPRPVPRVSGDAGPGAGGRTTGDSHGPERSPASDGPVGPRSREVLRGGTWIGILERLAITTSLLLGYPAAIAFVIAVKGLGRYPELRENPEASERFVIGTLASMLWAVGVGGGARLLLA